MKVERDIKIDRPPTDVWRTVMDPRRLEDWVTIHEELEEAPRGQLEQGDELTQRLRVGGTPFVVQWTVVRADAPRLVRWEGTGPVGTTASVEYELRPEHDGTRFWYRNEYGLPGGSLARLTAGAAVAAVAGREADRSLERLKALVERDPT